MLLSTNSWGKYLALKLLNAPLCSPASWYLCLRWCTTSVFTLTVWFVWKDLENECTGSTVFILHPDSWYSRDFIYLNCISRKQGSWSKCILRYLIVILALVMFWTWLVCDNRVGRSPSNYRKLLFRGSRLVLPLSGFGMKCAAALFFLTWFPFMIPPSLLSPRYQARPEACCRYSMEEYVT